MFFRARAVRHVAQSCKNGSRLAETILPFYDIPLLFFFFLFLPGVEQFALNPIRVRHGCREGEGEGAEEEEDRGEER